MKPILSKEELNEKLCEYCPYTRHGSEMEAKQCGCGGIYCDCDGIYCDIAYTYYLDDLSECDEE